MNYSKLNNNYKGNVEFLYAKISANLTHFFGNTSLEEHKDVLRCYLAYKESSYNRFINAINYVNLIQPNKSIIDEIDKSNIIYSYCIGEYRMLPILLTHLGYNITILMEGRIKKQQADLFLALNDRLNGSKLSKQKLKFVSSDESNIIWTLKSDIANGNKVLVFIDGNSGVNKNIKNLLSYSFFSQTVFLHQGISYLSDFVKTVPIGIVLFYDEGFTLKMFKHEDCSNSGRSLLVAGLTNEIYSNLEELINTVDISKWDALEGIYKWLDTENLNFENYENGEKKFLDNANVEFNAFRYSPFYLDKDYFIFDKKQYLTYRIQKKDYRRYIKHIQF